MMQLILPNLFRFTSSSDGPNQPVNSYIWRVGDRLILIDPAIDLDRAQLPLDLPVTDILVTHLQEEHAAGAANFPDARLYVPLGDEYLCHGRGIYSKPIRQTTELDDWGRLRGATEGNLVGAPIERPLLAAKPPTGGLADGDTFAGAKIIGTPGQGKHAVTILASIDGRQVAFCGDLIVDGGRLWSWFDSEWDYGKQTGQKALKDSAERLMALGDLLLCPSHGEPITDSARELGLLASRLEKIFEPVDEVSPGPINFPEKVRAPGFRELTPHLHQWIDGGNCAVLISSSGHALMIDDGLCNWVDLPERKQHHDRAIAAMKEALGVDRVEIVIPTHYHGDHIENIPDLVATDGAEVVCLDLVADSIEHGQEMGLACPLIWYATSYDAVGIDRRVKSGEILKWREYEIEIFHLGGQTFYHLGVSVLVDGLQVLFVGDAMNLEMPPGDAVICYNDAEPYGRGWAYALDHIARRNPNLIVCGHGSAILNPEPYVLARKNYWTSIRPTFDAISARTSLREFFDPFYDNSEPIDDAT